MEEPESDVPISRLELIKQSLKEKLDLFVRFMRSKWMAYLFLIAYITMLLTLLLMVFIIIRYSFIPDNSQPKTENPALERTVATSLPLPIIYFLMLLVVVVLGLTHYRWSSFYGAYYRQLEYQQIWVESFVFLNVATIYMPVNLSYPDIAIVGK